jgi:Predicted small metal-binding protein
MPSIELRRSVIEFPKRNLNFNYLSLFIPAINGEAFIYVNIKFKYVIYELTNMPYSFKCKDVGMNCGFEVKGATSEEEVLSIAKVHAEKAHGLREVPKEVVEAVKKAIKKE